MSFVKLILSSQFIVFQILLLAYIGALCGEMSREIDDDKDVQILNFIGSWISSGFCGVMVGLSLKGTLGKDNIYIVLSGSGIAGFLGRKNTTKFCMKALNILLKKIE